MSEEISDVSASWRPFLDAKIKRRKWLIDIYVKYVEKLDRGGLPPIFDFTHLSLILGIDKDFLARMITTPSSFYRTFEIPKRTGGIRRICSPSPTMLYAQRWILTEIFSKVTLHEKCYGYVSRRSSIQNAATHLGNPYMIKIDIKDFFPSIGVKRIMAILNRMGYSRRVSFYIAQLCSVDGVLPQGAATSPAISNIIAKRLDARINGLARSLGSEYTRYADDMTISGSLLSANLIPTVSRMVREKGFNVNRMKTRFLGPDSAKIVTGVSISTGVAKLPRRQLRELKHSAHYLLKNGIINYSEKSGVNDPILVERLIG